MKKKHKLQVTYVTACLMSLNSNKGVASNNTVQANHRLHNRAASGNALSARFAAGAKQIPHIKNTTIFSEDDRWSQEKER